MICLRCCELRKSDIKLKDGKRQEGDVSCGHDVIWLRAYSISVLCGRVVSLL